MQPARSETATLEVRESLRLGRRAPHYARRALDCLERLAPPDVLDMARLLVSELVTNSLQHSGISEGGVVQLRIRLLAHSLRVEVADAGKGFEPRVRIPGQSQAHGRGMFVVDRVADRWGTVPNGGILVWAELDLP
jgi:anti-sigma regulatory factor (Ser/Thr protein kinase)